MNPERTAGPGSRGRALPAVATAALLAVAALAGGAGSAAAASLRGGPQASAAGVAGEISTVAGGVGGPGPGLRVGLRQPCGVSYAGGAVYIGDELTVRLAEPADRMAEHPGRHEPRRAAEHGRPGSRRGPGRRVRRLRGPARQPAHRRRL